MWDSTAPPVGVIAGTESKPVLYDDWIELIRVDGRLQTPPVRERVNPRTGLTRVVQPDPSIAMVVRDGVRVGTMCWSEEEGIDEVVVYGDEPYVIALATELAANLGGIFRPLTAEDLEIPPDW